MRILFIASSRIGDAVISSGILEHLRLTYPQALITVAVGVVAQDVFAHLPNLERLIVFDKEKFDFHWLRLWLKLVPQIWDIVVDVRGSGLPYFLLAKRRKTIRGGRRPGRRYEQLGAAMGLKPAPLPVAWTNDADAALAAQLLPQGAKLIGPWPHFGTGGKNLGPGAIRGSVSKPRKRPGWRVPGRWCLPAPEAPSKNSRRRYWRCCRTPSISPASSRYPKWRHACASLICSSAMIPD